ncbi:MAG: DUF58 domain-containing protein [Eubacterium sp.]|nr:DUF58 domain-containing protein [Eubacterium sp.]
MTVGTFLYALLALLGVVICIFYIEFGTVAIAGVLAIVPVFMFLFLIFMRTRVLTQVDAKNPVAEKDDMNKPARASITLTVENKNRILPVTKGVVKVRYENFFSGEKGKMKVRFSVDAGRKRDRRIVVPMLSCGDLAIRVERVRIYDYLSIFAWTVGKNYPVQHVLILPPTRDMYLGKDRWYNETEEDSDRFSLYKKGDDPSEVFNIREFADGDKIQRIHWKLSSKTGELMVKEGSLPLTRALHIFIDLCIADDENRRHNADLLIQGIYSISLYMIEHMIPQHFIWYNRENDIIEERLVEHEEELLWMFQDLFTTRCTESQDELVQAYLAWDEGRPPESAMYLTVADHGDLTGSGLTSGRLEVMDLRGERFGEADE